MNIGFRPFGGFNDYGSAETSVGATAEDLMRIQRFFTPGEVAPTEKSWPDRSKIEPSNPDDDMDAHKDAFDPPYEKIEMDDAARNEMYQIHLLGGGKLNGRLDKNFWFNQPDYQHFTNWVIGTFEKEFKERLKDSPKGLIVKDPSVSFKDVKQKRFSPEAQKEAEERVSKMYPHEKQVDDKTIALHAQRILFPKLATKTADEAIECSLCSERVWKTLEEYVAYNKPFYFMTRGFDETIDPACEKRMGVVKQGDCPKCVEDDLEECPKEHQYVKSGNTEPEIKALTSYTTPLKRLQRRVLPAGDYYAQIVYETSKNLILQREKVIFPNPNTTRTVVDLCVLIDTNTYANHSAKFIERNSYDKRPLKHIYGVSENDLEVVSCVFSSIKKGPLARLNIVAIMNVFDAYINETILLRDMEGNASVCDMGRFNWYADRMTLYVKASALRIKVDICDYYADYTRNAMLSKESDLEPVTCQQFEDTYFAQENHKTKEDEFRFMQQIRILERENLRLADEARKRIASENAQKAAVATPISTVAVDAVEASFAFPAFPAAGAPMVIGSGVPMFDSTMPAFFVG